MCEIAMTIPDESLAALADSPEVASMELRMLAAVKLYEMKKLSSGEAARLAGISLVEFLSRLGAYGVAAFDMLEELERETAPLEAHDDETCTPMRWEGNVLVYDGEYKGSTEDFIDELREERIRDFFPEGSS